MSTREGGRDPGDGASRDAAASDPMTADQHLADAERRLREAAASRDRAVEADAHTQKAYAHTARAEIEQAVAEMTAARDIYAALAGPDSKRNLCRAEYGLGMLLERIAGRADDAVAAYGRGAGLAREHGDRAQQMKAQHRVVGVYQAAGRLADATAELTLMIAELEAWDNHRGLLDCYRHRAAIAQLAGSPRDALDDYDRAVAAADAVGDDQLALQARIERLAMQPVLDPGGLAGADGAGSDDWDDLIARADASGDAQMAATAKLQRAAELRRSGQLDDALALCGQAREAALAANAPILYLLACLLTAEGRDAAGDRPGVIAILLTCKATLERELGKAMGAPVVQVLDSLPARWGVESFQAALAEYRARAAEYAP